MGNVRPDSMAHITTPELALAFIDEQLPICITREVEGINRVLIDFTPKPIGMIEWE